MKSFFIVVAVTALACALIFLPGGCRKKKKAHHKEREEAVAIIASNTWREIPTLDMPKIRSGKAVWTGNDLIVFGEPVDGETYYCGAYNPDSDTWRIVSHDGIPTPKIGFSMVWTGAEVIIWGGMEIVSSNCSNAGGIYNPIDDTWRPMSLDDAPYPRFDHAVVWTGEEMLIWCGGNYTIWDRGEEDLFDFGSIYNPSTDTWRQMADWTEASKTAFPSYEPFGGSFYSPTVCVFGDGELYVSGGILLYTPSAIGICVVWGWYDLECDSWEIFDPDITSSDSGFFGVWTGSDYVFSRADFIGNELWVDFTTVEDHTTWKTIHRSDTYVTDCTPDPVYCYTEDYIFVWGLWESVYIPGLPYPDINTLGLLYNVEKNTSRVIDNKPWEPAPQIPYLAVSAGSKVIVAGFDDFEYYGKQLPIKFWAYLLPE